MPQGQVQLDKPHVRISLRKRNAVGIDAMNFQGNGCALATKRFSDLLSNGAQAHRVEKQEMHMEPEVNTVPVRTES